MSRLTVVQLVAGTVVIAWLLFTIVQICITRS